MAGLALNFFQDLKQIASNNEIYQIISHCQWPTTLLAFSICYTIYYLTVVVRRPKLICGRGWLLQNLLKNLKVLNDYYWPTFWCFSAHLMTVCRVIFKRKPFIPYRRELLETPDGGLISLDWLDNDEDNMIYPDAPKRPIVTVMPGLTGCSEASYCRHLVLAAKEMGMRALVMNNRGCGKNIFLKTPRTFCGNNTEDLSFVLKHVASIYPDSPIFGIGVSLGGCIMSHWLAQIGDMQSQMIGAFIVSVPWNCFHSTSSLERPLNWLLFNRHLTRKLLGMLQRNVQVFDQQLSNLPYNLDHVFKVYDNLDRYYAPRVMAKNIREFDDRFTSKSFGYRDYVEYYNAASLDAAPLENISVPTLFLNSADDPFSPVISIPQGVIEKNPSLALLLTEYGGHIGFTDGLFIRSKSIVENAFVQFAKSVLERREIADAKPPQE